MSIIVLCFYALVQAALVIAGSTLHNGFWGVTEECCNNPRYSYTSSGGGSVYQLTITTRQWYTPGYNFGPLYCKSNTTRTVYNSASTGYIYTSVASTPTDIVSQHYYDWYGTGTVIGYFYSSTNNNAYANSSYYSTGYGLNPTCDSALIVQ